MSKRRKNRKASSQKKGNSLMIAAFLVLALVGGGLTSLLLTQSGPGSAYARVPGGEKRAPLSPSLFSGDVARAYQVAHEIPGVLDQLYCHCKCIENSGHLSNLSCFADRHGAG